MKIFLKVDKHYNKTFYYPACDASRLFAQLTGTKTLTESSLKVIRKLGYDLCVVTSQILPAQPYQHVN